MPLTKEVLNFPFTCGLPKCLSALLSPHGSIRSVTFSSSWLSESEDKSVCVGICNCASIGGSFLACVGADLGLDEVRIIR